MIFKILVILVWILLLIYAITFVIQLWVLKKGYNFLYRVYGVKNIEGIREKMVEILGNRLFKMKTELLISSSIVIFSLLAIYVLIPLQNKTIDFSPNILLWFIACFVAFPLFVIIYEAFLKRTILEIDSMQKTKGSVD